jgi:hypothetical protein
MFIRIVSYLFELIYSKIHSDNLRKKSKILQKCIDDYSKELLENVKFIKD